MTSALLGLGLVIGAATTTAGALPAFAASEIPAASSGTATQTTSAPLSAITAGGVTAMSQAQAAVAAAAKVTMDVSASGLDIGTTDTVVDTTKLGSLITKLRAIDVTPAMMIPSLTSEASAETDAVVAKTSSLRSALEGAVQRKAAADAAAKAAAEAAAAKAAADAAAAAAAAQAKADEEAAAKEKASVASSSSRPAVNVNVDPASAQGIARSMAAANYGWGDDQFACLVSLWNKESGWRVNAANGSGAYGIPQALPGSKMASAGADWETNPATQIAWGMGYIAGRYGTPCGAWDHSESSGWY